MSDEHEVPAEPTPEVAPEPVAEPIEDGKAALVGAPPAALPEEDGGAAALVGHPTVADEVQPLTGQPEYPDDASVIDEPPAAEPAAESSESAG